jgi:hypothetical protein
MSNLVQMLVSTLVPLLMQEAEALLGVKPDPNDSSWVSGLLKEMVGLISKWIPGWLAPEVDALEQLIAAEVEKYLPKI